MSAKDKPHSKHATDSYRNGFNRIFRQKEWSEAMDKTIDDTKPKEPIKQPETKK